MMTSDRGVVHTKTPEHALVVDSVSPAGVLRPWVWRGQPLTETPKGYVGFVYVIHDSYNDRYYIGMKAFSWLVAGKGSRRRRVDSDWRTYTGSSVELNEAIRRHGVHWFDRWVLSMHRTKGSLRMEEVRQILVRDAINDPRFYNLTCGRNMGGTDVGSVHAEWDELPRIVRPPIVYKD